MIWVGRLSRIQKETMPVEVGRVELRDIEGMRDIYRHEMNCQIIHDSVHRRPGWSHEYAIAENGVRVGYGSVAVAGPWQEIPTLYEFFVLPPQRRRVFEAFGALLAASGVTRIETQSNDPLLTAMLLAFAPSVSSGSILFHDKHSTTLRPAEAQVRRACVDDADGIAAHELDSEASWVVTVGGVVAGAGDILYHYNRPYGDIYMKVGEPFRNRGLGSFLVQELKRICYEGGSIPAARCNPKNVTVHVPTNSDGVGLPARWASIAVASQS
jgi:GNAT superfamily N-acetyltransferase